MSSIRLSHTVEFLGKGLWKWALFLEGEAAALDRVTAVTYTLPSSMPEPFRATTDRASGFRIEGEAWVDFSVWAVADEPGTTGHQFEHQIHLSYPAETTPVITSLTVTQRLTSPGPKRILTLDGGGLRTLISLGVLERMEDLLRQKSGNPNLVLADYFDLVAGVSMGSVVAAGVALGMTVASLRDQLTNKVRQIFTSSSIFEKISLRSLYSSENAVQLLKEYVKPGTTLGGPELKTGLMIALLNASTETEWIVTNNPSAPANDPTRPDCPLKAPLWQLLRGSTAAPTYFTPEFIRLGNREIVAVDAEITAIGNLAFHSILTATSAGSGFGWPAGPDKLLLVSVGTGFVTRAVSRDELQNRNMLTALPGVIHTLMQSAKFEQDRLCRIFGRTRFAPDLPAGSRDLLLLNPANQPLFSYVRYDHGLNQPALDDLGLRSITAESVQSPTATESVNEFQMVGRAIAQRQVQPSHFEGF